MVGRLSGGFLWREIRLCVLTDHEIFGRFRRRRSRRRFRAGITLPDLMALKPGDYVVHVDHGIGVYQGTRRLTVGGHETDCIEIHYQRGDKLKRHCEARLKAAQMRIEQIALGPDGAPTGTKPFDVD